MIECGKPCYCHYVGTGGCCASCKPPKVVAVSALNRIAGEPKYNDPEDSPLNERCVCDHPKRMHGRICLIAGCGCNQFLSQKAVTG